MNYYRRGSKLISMVHFYFWFSFVFEKTFGLHLVLVIKSENMKWKRGGKWGKEGGFLSKRAPPTFFDLEE